MPARVPILAATLLLLASLLPIRAPHAQTATGTATPAIPLSALPRTTQEHLRAAAWWPTKLLSTQAGFVGSAACAGCHAEFATEQAGSQMARTLSPAGHSAVLGGHLHDAFHSGPYTTTVTASRTGFVLHTTDGAATLDAVPQWAFGSGEVGQSYLWQSPDGAFHESRFNFFHAPDAFVDTPGRLHGTPTSLAMAASRPIEPFEAQSCFRCHVTTMPASLPTDTAKIVPGVGCEACHGPGAAHVAAARAQAALPASAPKAPWNRHILNPENLSPTDAVDLCGSCHSTPADVRLMGAVGPQTVRFPAYRLENSRCWLASAPAGAGDDRLTCQSCHDPHAPLDHVAQHYDKACLGCHTAPAHASIASAATAPATPKTCPVATHDCTSCHMPRITLPEMHTAFTDHQIRTPHPNQPFPDTPALSIALNLNQTN